MATTSSSNNSTNCFPLCVLTPCSNSHPFDERKILVTRSEEDAVKIGRSVVRVQPSPNNAIFDCKVLSRNHAILWMNGAGQFMIKDTRSSNGTFINNERLSVSGEDSEPRELFSGDILQLGVEIVDTAKKVASGCVMCIVRLLNERGEECAERPKVENGTLPNLLQQVPHNYTLVKNDKLFILDQYIKEAAHRENLLGLKLQTLEEQLRTAQEALQTKWQEHVDQELLLSRIEQLEFVTKVVTTVSSRTTSKIGNDNNATGASTEQQQRLTTEVNNLAEDRGRIEQMAKESLRAMQEQVQETAMKLHDAEMSLVNVEEECTFLRQRCTDFETQMGRHRDEYETLLVKYNLSQELLQNRVEPTTITSNDITSAEAQQREEHVQEAAMKLQDTEMKLKTMEEECTLLRQRCTDFETQLGLQRDEHESLLVKYNLSQELLQNCIDEQKAIATSNDLISAEPQQQEEQVQEKAMELHDDAEMSLKTMEEECTLLRQRCTNFETQMGIQRDEYQALHDKYNSHILLLVSIGFIIILFPWLWSGL